MQVSVADAKNKLPELIKAVEDGRPVTICRRGVPVVDIVRTKKPTGKKRTLGKLKVTASIVRQAVQDLDIRLLPYTGEHAFRLFELPPHHSDPFDRQIIAQALSEKISVVTPDEKFRLYGGLKITW